MSVKSFSMMLLGCLALTSTALFAQSIQAGKISGKLIDGISLEREFPPRYVVRGTFIHKKTNDCCTNGTANPKPWNWCRKV